MVSPSGRGTMFIPDGESVTYYEEQDGAEIIFRHSLRMTNVSYEDGYIRILVNVCRRKFPIVKPFVFDASKNLSNLGLKDILLKIAAQSTQELEQDGNPGPLTYEELEENCTVVIKEKVLGRKTRTGRGVRLRNIDKLKEDEEWEDLFNEQLQEFLEVIIRYTEPSHGPAQLKIA